MRALPMDTLPGPVGLVLYTQGSADAFIAEQISDDIISPDIVIDDKLFSNEGTLAIDNVLAWDMSRTEYRTNSTPDISTTPPVIQSARAGLVRDNRVSPILPTADSEAEQTRPSANEGSTESRFVDQVEFFSHANEENAAGDINIRFDGQKSTLWPSTLVKTNMNVHRALLDAHYHAWMDSTLTGIASVNSIGMLARRIEVDFIELTFDRNTILGILNAVDQVF